MLHDGRMPATFRGAAPTISFFVATSGSSAGQRNPRTKIRKRGKRCKYSSLLLYTALLLATCVPSNKIFWPYGKARPHRQPQLKLVQGKRCDTATALLFAAKVKAPCVRAAGASANPDTSGKTPHAFRRTASMKRKWVSWCGIFSLQKKRANE